MLHAPKVGLSSGWLPLRWPVKLHALVVRRLTGCHSCGRKLHTLNVLLSRVRLACAHLFFVPRFTFRYLHRCTPLSAPQVSTTAADNEARTQPPLAIPLWHMEDANLDANRSTSIPTTHAVFLINNCAIGYQQGFAFASAGIPLASPLLPPLSRVTL